MTEISFLIDLFLNHKLPKAVKVLIAERIKGLSTTVMVVPTVPKPLHPFPGAPQAASTMALLEKHPDLIPPAVAVIAQTAAASEAMNSRESAIANAISGKVEKGRTSPRKF